MAHILLTLLHAVLFLLYNTIAREEKEIQEKENLMFMAEEREKWPVYTEKHHITRKFVMVDFEKVLL